jgi:ABC-2 type transport system permease protein
LVFVAVSVFVDLEVKHIWYSLFFITSAAMLLAALGIFAGVIAETFDQMAAVTSYIITPLTFLSGTFYSVHKLPPFWQTVSHYNPFYYMIDGFRYGLTGYSDSSVSTGIVVMIISNIVVWAVVQIMISYGYRIKS